MRVLIITPELPSPGAPGSMAPTARQIRSLRDQGISIDVMEMKGVPKLKYAQALFRQRTLLRSVDLVHAHFGYCGWLARMQLKKPVVVSFMGDDLLGTPRHDGRLEWFSKVVVRANRRLARWVDAVIVKSPEMARVVAPVNAHVIPNGVDTELFRPVERHEARRTLGLEERKLLVLFPGDPTNPRKCYPLAQAAVEWAGKLLGRQVELHTLWNVPPSRVPLLMNACDAMLMTSLVEGSPNVVKEAMACNLPVLSVPVGDVAELLAGVDGYCLCPRDAQALGRQLAATLSHGSKASGRTAIQNRGLDLVTVAKRVVDVYDQVFAYRNHAYRIQFG